MRLLVTSIFAVTLFTVTTTLAATEEQPNQPQKPVAVNWAHIELKGSYPEGAQAPPLFGETTESLATALRRLDKAAGDDKISGVVLRINGPSIGRGKLHELRLAIGRVRDKGKQVYAWLDGGTSTEYLLATACDQICMPESASLMIIGLRAEVSFYKNLFDMLGIQPDMIRVGKFKSAAEPFTRTEMSPEFRQEIESILDDYFDQMIHVIAEARQLDPQQVEAAINAAPLTAAEAKRLGLIDRVVYQDQLEDSLRSQNEGATLKIARKYGKRKVDLDFSGFAGFIKIMNMFAGVKTRSRTNLRPKLAVIYATGAITTGKSQSGMFGGQILGSETLIKAIRKANDDSTVKAIVLRIDSPGGSALASDLMWHELERVEKPFIVSMGDTAASGGYYIAMGADRIFAEPGTLTGSIGVVGGKLALQGLLNKLGITTSIVSRGEKSGLFSTTTGFSESERATMVKLLNSVYEQFTSKAAQGRGMELAQLLELAGGRIYTGRQALEAGLVDELGTLSDAIAAAKAQAGFKPEDKLELQVLPKAVSPLEALFGPLDPDARAQTSGTDLKHTLSAILPELAKRLEGLQVMELLGRQRVLTLMPFQLMVK